MSSSKYNPTSEANIVIEAIEELEAGKETDTLLWLHQDTAKHYMKLKNVIAAKLNGGEISQDGIPGNPSYVVFSRSGYDYALYLDRECDEDGQVMHLEKYNKGKDYSKVWS